MKWISGLILTIMLFTVSAVAQQSQKKVIITKKTIDANGNESVETIEAEGDEADKLLKDMDIEMDGDIDDIDINIDGDSERFQFRFGEGGDMGDIDLRGLENMPEELSEMLEALSLRLGDIGDIDIQGFNGFDGENGFSGFNTNSNKAQLGVRVEDTEGFGARVNEITEDSAADKAGIKMGDVITHINGLEIENADVLIRKMRKYEPQERIEIEVARAGKKKTFKVTLQERGERY